MQNHFSDWGKFDDPVKEGMEESEGAESEAKADVLENDHLLRSNSFERVYSIDGARKYLVHSEDPNKYQYSPLSVETNDKLYINLFLPKFDEITATRNVIASFKKLVLCGTFDEFLSEFEGVMYTMSNAQRITHVIGLRKYYNEYRNNLYISDGFDKYPPKDDGYLPVGYQANEDCKADSVGDLPF